MKNLQVFTESRKSMSSSLDITILYPASKSIEAKQHIQAAYDEANRLIGIISAWEEGTELYTVNSNAGIAAVKVGKELFELIKRSVKLSDLTEGYFDVTFASIDKVWYFDKPMIEIPTAEKITSSVRNINYKYIQLNEEEQTIYITNKGTKIELGAVGKGYIANKMKIVLQDLGVEAGLISAGGDMVCWGDSIHDNGYWKIGVRNPNPCNNNTIAWLPIKNQSIATSGNYERYAIFNGEMYSHIINPKTGYPVKGIKSVTVLSPDAELCDVIATTVFLKGRVEGLQFVNQFFDIQCFIVDENDTYYYSDNLKSNYSKVS